MKRKQLLVGAIVLNLFAANANAQQTQSVNQKTIVTLKEISNQELLRKIAATTITIAGKSDEGTVLETANKEKYLLRNGKPVIIKISPNYKWTPFESKTQNKEIYKLIGTGDAGNLIWETIKSTGRCCPIIIDIYNKVQSYTGHVTLLR